MRRGRHGRVSIINNEAFAENRNWYSFRICDIRSSFAKFASLASFYAYAHVV